MMLFGRRFDRFGHLCADERDCAVEQVADHRFDVAAVVADLRVLRRLDLDERRAGETSQPPRDLRLSHAGRPDHDDVLRRHVLPHRFGELAAAPSIAHRDRDGALSVGLADDVLVELGNDLLGGEVVHVLPDCLHLSVLCEKRIRRHDRRVQSNRRGDNNPVRRIIVMWRQERCTQGIV